MISKSTLLAATTLIVATAVPSATALAATNTSYPPAKRPHSRVVTYDRGDVLVRQLQLRLTRADHRLRAGVHLRAHNETAQAIDRVLRIGPCVGGYPGYPTCRDEATWRVRIPAHGDVYLHRTIRLHQPPPGIDTLQAALVVPGARQPYAIAAHSDASLLLRGRAWRGPRAGHPYGVVFHADAARRLSFDIPATSPRRAYIDVKWTGTAAPSAATTTISRCSGDDCTDQTLHPTAARSGPQTFGQRFDYEIHGADAVGLAAGGPGATLFDALLPWPG